jgi:hypothetical protein
MSLFNELCTILVAVFFAGASPPRMPGWAPAIEATKKAEDRSSGERARISDFMQFIVGRFQNV